MNHLAYYQYQATARGIQSVDDVKRNVSEKAYLYDRIVLPRLPANKQSRVAELACGHGAFLGGCMLMRASSKFGLPRKLLGCTRLRSMSCSQRNRDQVALSWW